MLQQRKTLFDFYSVATVAEDPEGEGWFIRCWPQDQIPTVSGKIDDETKVKRNVKDPKGNVEAIEMTTQKTVLAEWCPIGQINRVTPPNIRKGMTVLLYRYADNPDFIWTPLLLEPDRMTYEKVIHAYSNKPEPKIEEGGPDIMDECWYTVVDTEAKLWELHTTDNDGEATVYEMGLDLKGGQAIIRDGEGNHATLDSVEGTLTTHLNGDWNATIDKNINMEVTEDINLKVTKNVNVEVEEDVNVKVTKNVNTEITENYDMKITQNMNTEVTEDTTRKSKNITEEVEENYTQNTKNSTIAVQESMNITTDKLSIANGTTEIISWLVELIDTMIQEKHTGNLGIPTAMDPGSVQQFMQLQEKIKSFM